MTPSGLSFNDETTLVKMKDVEFQDCLSKHVSMHVTSITPSNESLALFNDNAHSGDTDENLRLFICEIYSKFSN